MKKIRNRIRKKGECYVLEQLIDGKIKKSWNLNPNKLARMFDVSVNSGQVVSNSTKDSMEIIDQKFSQCLLREPLNETKSDNLFILDEEKIDYTDEEKEELKRQHEEIKRLGL